MDVGLKFKPTKCYFARSELVHLGHTITREGVTLVVLSQIHPELSQGCYPLHQLTHKDVAFAWTQDGQEVFDTEADNCASPCIPQI